MTHSSEHAIVVGVAHHDSVVADAYAMVTPPQHILRPRIAGRLLRGPTPAA